MGELGSFGCREEALEAGDEKRVKSELELSDLRRLESAFKADPGVEDLAPAVEFVRDFAKPRPVGPLPS